MTDTVIRLNRINMDLPRTCRMANGTPKREYPKRAYARRAARHLSTKMGARLHAYRCDEHPGRDVFHIGNSPIEP